MIVIKDPSYREDHIVEPFFMGLGFTQEVEPEPSSYDRKHAVTSTDTRQKQTGMADQAALVQA